MNDSNPTFDDRVISELYPIIRASHPCWSLLIFATISTAIAIVGDLCHFSLLYVTIRTKTLRGSVNILLAAYSLSEIAPCSSFFLLTFSAFSGHYFMPFKLANRLMLPVNFFAPFSFLLMLFIAIERLFAVLFPLKAVKFNFLLFIVLPISCLCAIGNIYWQIYFDQHQPYAFEILGSFSEIVRIAFNGKKNPYGMLFTALFFLFIMFIYGAISVLIRFRKIFAPSNANSAQFNAKVLRSLFIIVLVNFGGYLAAVLFFWLIYSLIENPMFLWCATQIIYFVFGISAMSNAPILYFTSTDYRKAYQKQFAFVFSGTSSTVTPLN